MFSSYLQPIIWAGNPDRSGQAGAYELLINPYASAEFIPNTANVQGVESMRLNVAGLADIYITELVAVTINGFKPGITN